MELKAGTRTYQEQRRTCGGHERCATCKELGGHGPYWYVFFRVNGRLKSKYLGKLKEGQTVEELDAEKQERRPKIKQSGKKSTKVTQTAPSANRNGSKTTRVKTSNNGDEILPESILIQIQASLTLFSNEKVTIEVHRGAHPPEKP